MWSSRLNGRIAVVPVVTGKLTLECKIWLITGKTMSHVRRLQRNETWSTTSAGSQSNKLATETVCSPCYLKRTNANTYNYLMTQPTLLVNNASALSLGRDWWHWRQNTFFDRFWLGLCACLRDWQLWDVLSLKQLSWFTFSQRDISACQRTD